MQSSDTDVRAVLDGIRLIVRELRESSCAAERRFGVTAAQLFVLRVLAESPAGSLNDLAERTFTHQSSVSVVVSRLTARRLVARTPSADDRRRREIALTSKGRALLSKAPAAAQERLIEGLERLAPDERRRLACGLAALNAAMGADRRPPTMLFEEAARGRP